MVIEKELNLSCNCNTVLTEVVEDQEAKGMNLSRMCEWIKETNQLYDENCKWITLNEDNAKFTKLRQPRR